VLMITHNPEAAEFADRPIRMRDGQIVDAVHEPHLHPKK
jgi:ABC-type lipoprotein export system ATPase subunit